MSSGVVAGEEKYAPAAYFPQWNNGKSFVQNLFASNISK